MITFFSTIFMKLSQKRHYLHELKQILILNVIKWQKLKELIEGPDKKDVIEKLEVKEEGELGTNCIN